MTGLHSYFDSVALKQLTDVEVDPSVSHQHEFNGVAQLKPIFGTAVRRREVYATHFDMDHLGENPPNLVSLTWYDARFEHRTRTEWRLYYGAELAPSLEVGGRIVVAKRDDFFYLFTSRQGGRGAHVLERLFTAGELTSRFSRLNDGALDDAVAVAEQLVLAQLGIATDLEIPLAELFFERFGDVFPPGEQLSGFVRENTYGVDAMTDPDEALIAWARVELELFNLMESVVESEAMEAAEGLDEKLVVAMRIFQRRKSRAGKAFEYHLRALFGEHGIAYSPNPATERGERPDFIFPSIERYMDSEWPADKLVMLAAKQTLRDRWRQILQEADRIPRKHLTTLDVNISANQIREIDVSGIQLVVPAPLHEMYPDESADGFWTIAQFIERMKALQLR